MAIAVTAVFLSLGFAFLGRRLSFPGHLEPVAVLAPGIAALIAHLAFGFSQLFEVKALGRGTPLALLVLPLGLLGMFVTKHLSDQTATLTYIKRHTGARDILECPSCGTLYRLSDYRADVPQIICSGCKAVLAERTKLK